MNKYWLLLTVLVLSGCAPEQVAEPYLPSSAHDAYRHSLETTGLDDTGMGRDWWKASEKALKAPQPISLPFRETLFVDPAQPFASGLLFSAVRGQRVEISVDWEGSEELQVFVDLFRRSESPEKDAVHVASAAEGTQELYFEPRRQNEYLLRVQPELLRGGRCTISITYQAALLFPVSGHSPRNIQSRFGVSRDAGRRRHHGVDIFARRHTPVVAPSRAFVSRVRETPIGGKVIWLRDSQRNMSIYYAHLQTQSVAQGEWVEPGQSIGTVGNSGNARTTPPHLHFGVYARGEGPIDPQPFIDQSARPTPEVKLDTGLLGDWVRVKGSRATLRLGAQLKEKSVLQEHTPVRVIGARGSYYHVLLPDRSQGYLSESSIEALTPLRQARFHTARIRSDPAPAAPAVEEIDSSVEVPVLAEFGKVLLVHTAGGRLGWIDEE